MNRNNLDEEFCKTYLLLEQRGYPEDGDGADDGCAELSEDAAPLYAELREQPAAEDTTEESQYEIHDEAEASAFHQLTGTEACQATNDN